MELALPLINDTLYDCPDAAANSSESWEEKVSTPEFSFIKWLKDRLQRDGGLPFVAIISKGVKKQAFESFIVKTEPGQGYNAQPFKVALKKAWIP